MFYKVWGKFTPNFKFFKFVPLLAGPPLLYLVNRQRKCFSEERIYYIDDVKKHGIDSKDGYWIIYQNKVYNITEFIEIHPGGEIILNAVGGHVEPYFELYAFHKNDYILEFLEPYLIGTLSENSSPTEYVVYDPFHSDPSRSDVLSIISNKPFNAETPPHILPNNFYTPKETFFVRNHLPVPIIDVENYFFEVCPQEEFLASKLRNPLKEYTNKKMNPSYEHNCIKFTLDNLKKYPEHSLDVAIQCAGNRRNEFNQVEPVKGLQWSAGAIGNAKWTGVRLRDVLLDKYPDLEKETGYVLFEGFDNDKEANINYETSISLSKALHPDTMLAYLMNDEKILPDHGYPLRVIVPGVCGARNVKWLKKITISKEGSTSRWQKDDYKLLPSDIKLGEQIDYSKFSPIQGLPVTSYICNPKSFPEKNKDNKYILNVNGYAYSGNGAAIKEVYISINSGENWIKADLNSSCKDELRCYSWTLWNCNIDLGDVLPEKVEIISKATDSNNNTQPENIKYLWNMRGFLNHSWSKVVLN